jgi:hypothetical protein
MAGVELYRLFFLSQFYYIIPIFYGIPQVFLYFFRFLRLFCSLRPELATNTATVTKLSQ